MATILRARSVGRVAALLWLFLVHLEGISLTAFSTKFARTQLREQRKEEGLYVPLSIGIEEEGIKRLSGPVKAACVSIQNAVERKDWYAVKGALARSGRSSTTVFNMALAAALKLGNFEQGIKIFNELGETGLEKTLKSYCCAIRLYSQMGRKKADT